MSKFSEVLTPDNAVLAMIDHQTGLLVSLSLQLKPRAVRRL